MSNGRIVFDGVYKKFRRGERHDSLRDLIPAVTRRLFRPRPAETELDDREFWAVRDLSFDIGPGEALGIIGPNGAGKSTSLKLATRILRPERGRVEVRGRVGALIEIAAGFHPDLTGRENIFLQGAIMGMRRSDIERRLDEIVAFAGVESFIDTPVKRYAGMNARLGFSIAAHLEPDVLIIDEVLSVGDMTFQERCLERMMMFRRNGIPIVFVSHNLQAVLMLCNKAAFLKGEVKAYGPTDEVMQAYVSQSHTASDQTSEGALQIERADLLSNDADVTGPLSPGASLKLRVTYRATQRVSDCSLGFLLHRSTDMLVVHDANYTLAELGTPELQSGEVMTVDFSFKTHLTRGHYFLDCHVFHNPTQTFLSRLSPAGTFSIFETRSWTGVADLELGAGLIGVERVAAGAGAA